MTDMQWHSSSKFGFNRISSRPAVYICLSLLSGIIYARYFPVSSSLLLVSIVTLVSIWFVHAQRPFAGKKPYLHWECLVILAFLLGMLRYQIHLDSCQEIVEEVACFAEKDELTIRGKIEDAQSFPNGNAKATLSNTQLQSEHQKHSVPWRIQIYGTTRQISHIPLYSQITLKGKLIPIHDPAVPASYNRREYYFSKNIFATLSLDPQDQIQVLSTPASPNKSMIRGLSYKAADVLSQKISRNQNTTHSRDDIIGIISSICFGVRSASPEELRKPLLTSGLAHITSISGLHVTFLLLGITYLLKKSGLRRKQAAIVGFFLGLFYLYLVGPRIPAVRATLMAYIFLGHFFIERRVDSLNSLALIAILFLILYPSEVFLPSFQLSFYSVLILILYSPVFQQIFGYFQSFVVSWLLSAVFASALLGIGVAPFTIYHFHLFSWGAILGNLLAIPIVYLLLPLTYFVLIFPSSIGFSILSILADTLLEEIHFFSDHDIFWATVPFPGMKGCILVTLIVVLLSRPMTLFYQFSNVTIRAYHIVLLLAVMGLWFHILFSHSRPLRIDFLSLGQGDCCVIQTPERHTIIIDGGSPHQTLHNGLYTSLVGYLLSEGISEIDLMMLSHPQSDHIGVFEEVIRAFPVHCFLEGSTETSTQTYLNLLRLLQQKQIPRKQVRKGDHIKFEGATEIWILHPNSKSLSEEEDINENSIVAMLQHRGWEILFTGDIGIETELELCKQYENWDIDVLKVPHHGSRYSTSDSLLSEIKPEIGIIQVGRNVYGQPHSETIKRLQSRILHLFRTDQDGTVQLTLRKGKMQIYTTLASRYFIWDPLN